jgi:hypothetical protein
MSGAKRQRHEHRWVYLFGRSERLRLLENARERIETDL